jgi:putative colanic acid biosynthesis UDP-glucose lipid carrier transferase
MSEIWSVLEAWLAVAGVTVVAIYVQQDLVSFPPLTIAFWLAAAPVLLILWRISVRCFLRWARAQGYNTRTLAIAGNGDLARHVARTVADNPWMGLRVLGLFSDVEEDSDTVGVPGQQSLQKLIDLACNGTVDAVYIALPAGRAERQSEMLMRKLSDSTVSLYLVQDRRSRSPGAQSASRQVLPDLDRLDVLHRTCVNLSGIKAVSVYESPFLGPDGWVKRVEDMIISSLALVVLAIPMLIIAAGVKLSGPGPVMFKQRRYGLDGKEIMVWKFRSMSVCEDGDSVLQASKNDTRVTRFGAFLRKTSLDELPQFINVLGGSMSVVGPRPHAVAHNEYYRTLIGGYMLRHKVKPGITGWAQINGWRGETESIDKMGRRIDFDLDYIRNWSLWLDVRIIAATATRGFVHKNAY